MDIYPDIPNRAISFVIMAEIETLRFLSMKNPDEQIRKAANARLESAKAKLKSLKEKLSD